MIDMKTPIYSDQTHLSFQIRGTDCLISILSIHRYIYTLQIIRKTQHNYK